MRPYGKVGTMSRFWIALAVAGTALAAGISTAQAKSATGVIRITARALSSCTVYSHPLAFGDLVAHAEIYASTVLFVECNFENGPPITVVFDGGEHYDAASSVRQLAHTDDAGNAHYLAYSLYADFNRDGVLTRNKTIAIGNRAATIYGLIHAQSIRAEGEYSDTVQLTLNY